MNQLVIIDPGHGWGDAGAVRAGVSEAEITLGIGEYLYDDLKSRGQACLLTRGRRDQEKLAQRFGLFRRVQIANQTPGAVCFVSLHLNSMPEEEGGAGIEIFYQAPSLKGITLARSIETAYDLETVIRRRLPMVKPHADLYVLHKTRMPAVLIECGFISNIKEREFLNAKEGRQRMAQSLSAGIINWIHNKEVPSCRKLSPVSS